MLKKMREILNPKHQILNKSKYLNSNLKTNLSLAAKQKSLFLSLRFWYLIKPLQGLRGRGAEPHMFSISSLVLRIYKSTNIGQLSRKGGG